MAAHSLKSILFRLPKPGFQAELCGNVEWDFTRSVNTAPLRRARTDKEASAEPRRGPMLTLDRAAGSVANHHVPRPAIRHGPTDRQNGSPAVRSVWCRGAHRGRASEDPPLR